MGVLRQMLKPLYRYLREPGYREYLRVQDACRNKEDQTVTVDIGDVTIAGNDGPSLLHQYEEIVLRRSFDFKPGNASPVVYCCGANIGLEVVRLGKQHPAARIKAFEPDPVLYSILQKNVSRNSIHAETFNAAVHTSDGKLSFQSDGKLGGKIGNGSLQVNSLRLRDLLAQEQRIDLLLMDIEGAEQAVLNDCADQLTKIDQLFVEWHSSEHSEQALSDLLNLLKQSGFRYKLNNNLGTAPFENAATENGFDAMVEIYATRLPA